MADILLVHGSCHGAWCWRDVLPALSALGHDVKALDLPGHGQDRTPVEDVTLDLYADAILDAAPDNAVLVGHSMGGYAIAAAATKNPDRISRLIYLAAYVPQNGLTLAQMRMQAPRQPLLEAIRMSQDRQSFTLDPALIPNLFYHDCSPETLNFAMDNLCPQAIAPSQTCVTMTEKARAIPCRYIRCLQDRTVPPEFQHEMTKDWPKDHLEDLDCSHSPFFAMPKKLAEATDIAARN